MMIKTKFEDIPKITRAIGKVKGVKAVYLFGSYASGEQHALSDIDLCVLGKLSEDEETEVLCKGSDNLDISLFNNLPIYIKFRVFRDGKPLFIKDRNFVDLIKFYTLREYLDFKPILDRRINARFGKCMMLLQKT